MNDTTCEGSLAHISTCTGDGQNIGVIGLLCFTHSIPFIIQNVRIGILIKIYYVDISSFPIRFLPKQDPREAEPFPDQPIGQKFLGKGPLEKMARRYNLYKVKKKGYCDI
jgi:hypothetical protein